MQGFWSSQSSAPLPATHTPDVQRSKTEHASPSEQAAPSGRKSAWQFPVRGSHARELSHCPTGPQGTGAATQTPDRHASPVVQSAPSLHGAPSGTAALIQRPVVGWQATVAVHGPPGGHVVLAPPAQLPVLHFSPVVQASPSLHVDVLS